MAAAQLQQGPPKLSPWFEGAPITKTLCILWIIVHLVWPPSSNSDKSNINNISNISSNYDRDALSFESLFESLFWDVWVFSSTGSLLRGLVCLGHGLRNVERELSSRQVIVWILWNYLGTVSLRLLLLMTTGDALNPLTAAIGPYFLVGALLWWYIMYVPRLHPRFLTLGGISMSEKFLPYLGITYVMSHQGVSSILATAVGLASCALYFLMPLKLKQLVSSVLLPEFVVKTGPWDLLSGLFFVDPPPKIYAPLMMNLAVPPTTTTTTITPPPSSGNNGARGVGGGATPRGGTTPVAPRPAPAPPSQDAIDQLTAMGFDEARVKEALQQTGNNVERAADRLLSG